MRNLTIRTLSLVLILSTLSVGCRTMETTFGAPKAKLESAGAIDLDRSIPPADPTQVAIGEIQLKINSSLLDDEAKQGLGVNLRKVSGGLTSWKTRDKKPEYRILITQMNSADDWNASGMGALMGAGVGIGAGVAIDDDNYRGATVGGIGGAAVGAMAFGEQKDRWMFSVAVYRRTTEGAVRDRIDSLQNQNVDFQGGVSGDSYSLGGSTSASGSSTDFSFQSDEFPAFFSALLSVDSGTFHSSKAAEKAARELLVTELPKMIFGGEEIEF